MSCRALLRAKHLRAAILRFIVKDRHTKTKVLVSNLGAKHHARREIQEGIQAQLGGARAPEWLLEVPEGQDHCILCYYSADVETDVGAAASAVEALDGKAVLGRSVRAHISEKGKHKVRTDMRNVMLACTFIVLVVAMAVLVLIDRGVLSLVVAWAVVGAVGIFGVPLFCRLAVLTQGTTTGQNNITPAQEPAGEPAFFTEGSREIQNLGVEISHSVERHHLLWIILWLYATALFLVPASIMSHASKLGELS